MRKEVILFSRTSDKIVEYITGKLENRGYFVFHCRTLDEVNALPVVDVLTRGVTKEEIYQMKGKRWFNDIDWSKLADDKQRMKDYLKEKGLGGNLCNDYTLENLKEGSFEDYPIVVKPRKGKCGNGVQLVYSYEELECLDLTQFVLEQYIAERVGYSRDYRVYVLAGEIRCCIERTNVGLVSNVHAGGTVKILSEVVGEAQLLKVIPYVPLDVMAIDYTIDELGVVRIFEINSSPGVSALYAKGVDAYEAFLEWYCKKNKKNTKRY